MPKNTIQKTVQAVDQIDGKALAIKLAAMSAATVATLAAVYYVTKKIEETE